MRKKMRKALPILLSATMLMSATTFSTINGATTENVSVTAENAEENSVQTIALDADYAENEYLDVYGRTYYNTDNAGAAFNNSASGVEVRFVGTELTVTWKCKKSGRGGGFFSVYLDGSTEEANIVEVTNYDDYADVTLLTGLTDGAHSARILKRTACNADTCYISAVKTDGYFQKAVEDTRLKVEVYGDSITVGSGIIRDCYYDEGSCAWIDSGDYTNVNQNVFQSYAGVMAKELDARLNVFGRGGITMKYTSETAGYTVLNNYKSVYVDVPASEYPYDYGSYTPDVVVIYLGSNDYFQRDGAKPTFSVEGLKTGFEQFIREAIGENYGKDIPIFLCSGMMAPDSHLPEWMEDVKNRLQKDFPNLETVEFKACAIGHPVAAEGEVAGKQLATAIKNKLDTLKNQ